MVVVVMLGWPSRSQPLRERECGAVTWIDHEYFQDTLFGRFLINLLPCQQCFQSTLPVFAWHSFTAITIIRRSSHPTFPWCTPTQSDSIVQPILSAPRLYSILTPLILPHSCHTYSLRRYHTRSPRACAYVDEQASQHLLLTSIHSPWPTIGIPQESMTTSSY